MRTTTTKGGDREDPGKLHQLHQIANPYAFFAARLAWLADSALVESLAEEEAGGLTAARLADLAAASPEQPVCFESEPNVTVLLQTMLFWGVHEAPVSFLRRLLSDTDPTERMRTALQLEYALDAVHGAAEHAFVAKVIRAHQAVTRTMAARASKHKVLLEQVRALLEMSNGAIGVGNFRPMLEERASAALDIIHPPNNSPKDVLFEVTNAQHTALFAWFIEQALKHSDQPGDMIFKLADFALLAEDKGAKESSSKFVGRPWTEGYKMCARTAFSEHAARALVRNREYIVKFGDEEIKQMLPLE